VESLHLLHPARTSPKRNEESGKLFYELDGDPRKRKLPEDVLKFSGLGFNGLQGYNPCIVAKQSLGLNMAAEQFGAAFFGNGATPGGILKTLRKLGPQAVANLRNSLGQLHQGSQSAHQLMILEEGLEYQQTAIAPELAQFIATRQFGVIEVARMWSIPPHKIGDYSQAHLTNIEQSNIDYICTTLCGYVVMLEAQYNLKLLTREERKRYVILHDFSQLLRGDMAARIAWLQGMHGMGCMSADDILRHEGRNPIGPAKGGDKYLVQAQYIPLEKAGEVPFAPAPAKPPSKKKGVKDE
jgi:HK97 family phage portal protein